MGSAFALEQGKIPGVSNFEKWRILPAGDGYVFVASAAKNPNGGDMYLDAQAPGQNMPSFGDPVGTRPADRTASQQWKMEKNLDGTTSFVNRYSTYRLTYSGTGFAVAFVQRTANGGVLQNFDLTPFA